MASGPYPHQRECRQRRIGKLSPSSYLVLPTLMASALAGRGGQVDDRQWAVTHKSAMSTRPPPPPGLSPKEGRDGPNPPHVEIAFSIHHSWHTIAYRRHRKPQPQSRYEAPKEGWRIPYIMSLHTVFASGVNHSGSSPGAPELRSL